MRCSTNTPASGTPVYQAGWLGAPQPLPALAATPSGRPASRAWRRRSRAQAAQGASQPEAPGDWAAGLRQVARRVQGALPLVGLISRLAAPAGGIGLDELAYPEYCRAVTNDAPADFNIACAELEKRHGSPAQRRYILLFLWMARTGAALVPGRNIMLSARRLRATQDIEIEMDRFDNARDATILKYSYLERPKASVEEQVDIAIDALCRCCLGLDDGVAVEGEEDRQLLSQIVGIAFPPEGGGGPAQVLRSLDERPLRAKAYL